MDHIARVQRAVDFIEAHLREDLPTEAIARVAGFSMWHFQRIFGSVVGDTLKDSVRKRRLTCALQELTSTDRRILDIALDFQFESQEAFTRAFKGAFGVNPGRCKRQVKAGQENLLPLLAGKPKITIEYLDHLYRGITMHPKFVMTQEKKVIGMNTRFISIMSPERNNFDILPKLWRDYLARSREITSRLSPFNIGVCEQVPEGARTRPTPDECLYMAGAEVKNFDLVPDGMMTKVIPAGRYAVFTHKGQLETLEHTMNYIYGSWLPKSGEELRDAPDLEIYGERFKYGQEDSEVDLYIPIR